MTVKEEVIGRSIEGKEEVLTVKKICTGNPEETFETIQTVRRPIVQSEEKVEVKSTTKAKEKQQIFRDDLKRAPKLKK